MQTKVYYCEGMSFYGKRVPLERYNPERDSNDAVLFVGIYFEEDLIAFNSHKGKKIVFWNGSDVSRVIYNGWKLEGEAKHYCHNQQLKDELATIGIDAEIKPVFFGDASKYSLCFKPSNKPKLFMTARPGREGEYGVNAVLQIAPSLPEFEFYVYGTKGRNTRNVFYHGLIDEDLWDEETKDMQGCLRLNEHDGYSQIVMKAIMRGQHTIMSKNNLRENLLHLKNKSVPRTQTEKFYSPLDLLD